MITEDNVLTVLFETLNDPKLKGDPLKNKSQWAFYIRPDVYRLYYNRIKLACPHVCTRSEEVLTYMGIKIIVSEYNIAPIDLTANLDLFYYKDMAEAIKKNLQRKVCDVNFKVKAHPNLYTKFEDVEAYVANQFRTGTVGCSFKLLMYSLLTEGPEMVYTGMLRIYL